MDRNFTRYKPLKPIHCGFSYLLTGDYAYCLSAEKSVEQIRLNEVEEGLPGWRR